jgi:aspartyl-tRNA(Asn)/glutamyl-tRNA(Gln) amidotransferase subunit B
VNYDVIVGMEVHVQLHTRSKMFCRCSADYAAAPPNTHTCPICTAMPGVLPAINNKAVEYTVMTGLALNCRINGFSRFARKSYFYPDLPKNYQISQYELPLCEEGYLEIEVAGQLKRINIHRIHLEEDTAKLTHVDGSSLIDFNRSGVPLMEIVSEPDIRSAEEAHLYLTKLRTILRYLGVSTGNMEEGALRCEANVSLQPEGATELGTKVEVKNLNSFRSVEQSLAYEMERQAKILDEGGRVEQVTMGWDESRGVTVVQRSKEEAHDYRYFPEPDLPPLCLQLEQRKQIEHSLPELPDARRDRFVEQYGLSRYDALLLTADRAVAEFFESSVGGHGDAKTVCNWTTGEVFRLLKVKEKSLEESRLASDGLVELLTMVDKGTINTNTAKDVLEVMFDTGAAARTVVEERGLGQISDQDELSNIVNGVIAANPKPVADYLAGRKAAAGFLMGQVMKATRGKANPDVVRELLAERLGTVK